MLSYINSDNVYININKVFLPTWFLFYKMNNHAPIVSRETFPGFIPRHVGIYPRFRRGYFVYFSSNTRKNSVFFPTGREISVYFRISFARTFRAKSKNTGDLMLVTSSRYEGGMIMFL